MLTMRWRAFARSYAAQLRVVLMASAVAVAYAVAGPSVAQAAMAPTAVAAPQVVQAGAVLTPRQRVARRGLHVLRVAASKRGAPYRWGATGPGAFDCSGFTLWVYAHVGRHLPHSSSAQAGRVRRISGRAARPGDLVFFTSGGHVYHVAIYAGDHQIWHAARPGEGVRKERIWTSSVFYGRVR
jgi:cell wall-associated NlpC family hydrolase